MKKGGVPGQSRITAYLKDPTGFLVSTTMHEQNRKKISEAETAMEYPFCALWRIAIQIGLIKV